MHAREVFVVVATTAVLSGCAGQRSAQTLNRLNADVQLLDQRVSQLERASLREPSAMLPAESQANQPVSASAAEPMAKPATPATKPSLKPSKQEIQQALKNAGFYQGPLDGKLGHLTHEAVREFQRVHGLQVDGIVGKQTWEQLSPYVNPAAATSGEATAAETLK